MNRYFEQKTNPTSDENYLLTRLTGELSYFPISHICRDDLENKGFDVSNVTDTEMSRLADKLGNDYHEQLYWISMEIIAEDSIGIPKYICPQCGKKASMYNSYDKTFLCFSCQNTWKKEKTTGRYVLVEFLEANSMFRAVQWPESQKYFEIEPESIAALCEPIEADAKSIEDFGESSIWVPLCLIKS